MQRGVEDLYKAVKDFDKKVCGLEWKLSKLEKASVDEVDVGALKLLSSYNEVKSSFHLVSQEHEENKKKHEEAVLKLNDSTESLQKRLSNLKTNLLID